ncbi:hypothetical protein [Rhodopseudomonas telluris]|uniref:Uncharacterized protein n=1 Tax=Rhodopseudomonas telluris TaxID=644215 RepID=A0ABV6EYH7_9BRAD
MTAPRAEARECLAAPKGPAPAGSHWFYRTDHASKRNCWYVRAKDGSSAATASSASATDGNEASSSTPAASGDAASTDAPTARAAGANAAPKLTRNATTPLHASVANARAEVLSPPEPAPLRDAAAQDSTSQFPAPLPAVSAAAPSQDAAASGAPQADAAQGSSIDQRWADAHASDATAAANADASSKLRTAAQAAVAKGGTPATAAMATAGSAATLIAALLAALALAGLIVGGIFKFGRREPTIRRDLNGRPDIWSAAAKPASSDFVTDRITQDLDLSPPMQPVEPPSWIQAARQRQTAAISEGNEIEELLARAQKRPAA